MTADRLTATATLQPVLLAILSVHAHCSLHVGGVHGNEMILNHAAAKFDAAIRLLQACTARSLHVATATIDLDACWKFLLVQ